MSEFDLSKISHNEPPFETRLDADDLAIALDAAEDNLVLLRADNERLRGGLQLIATDTHRLMNEVARQTAASILGGKPIGATDQPSAAHAADERHSMDPARWVDRTPNPTDGTP